MSQKDLLLVSLGPIQDFIASARRCQDLWYGSTMLSEIARAAADGLRRAAGEADEPAEILIYPASIESGKAVANKILLFVERGRAAAGALAGEEAMQAELLALTERALDKLSSSDRETLVDVDRLEAQVGSLMEYYWVSVPLDESDYAGSRAGAERALAQRKSTRNWAQPNWDQGRGLPKSSLDGQRETVIREEAYETLTPSQRRKRLHIKKSEQLCGVGLVKRLGTAELDVEGGESTNPVFHSTSHVTAGPLLTREALGGPQGAFEEFLETLEGSGVDTRRFRIRESSWAIEQAPPPGWSGETASPDSTFASQGRYGYDGCLFYPGRARELAEEYSDGGKSVEKTQRDIEAAQLALSKRYAISEHRFPSYYAFLLADGDHMGRAFDILADVADHRDLSERVERFASATAEIIGRHGGSPIYAGGDDVLALLPLHTALSASRALAAKFEELVGAPFGPRLRTRDPEASTPTLSVGLGIAHHMSNMGEVRALAKSAERAAKDAGRNAFAIAIKKRSGPTMMVARRWDDAHPLADALDMWACHYHDRSLPGGFALELEELTRRFGSGPVAASGMGPVFEALALRAVGRKRASGGTSSLGHALDAMLRERITLAMSSPEPGAALLELAEELQIARLFERAYEVAWPAAAEGSAR